MRFLSLLTAARHSIPRVFPLMRDSRVPLWLKAATGLLAVLIVSPLDLFGDIPVLGIFDDAALLALLASAFVVLAQRMRERLAMPHGEPRVVTPAHTPLPE
ncbi:MAG TPA: hypothetical protein VKG44_11195 [Candidatus Baltobacteraceae bacterium]|nr:hypothetical protein [Candidatus Baltobacteraceae bacterium]